MEISADRLTRETLAKARKGYVTPVRLQLLKEILNFNAHSQNPTIRELGTKMNKSKSAVDDMVAALEAGGYITTRTGVRRSMHVTDAGRRLLNHRCPNCSHPL